MQTHWFHLSMVDNPIDGIVHLGDAVYVYRRFQPRSGYGYAYESNTACYAVGCVGLNGHANPKRVGRFFEGSHDPLGLEEDRVKLFDLGGEQYRDDPKQSGTVVYASVPCPHARQIGSAVVVVVPREGSCRGFAGVANTEAHRQPNPVGVYRTPTGRAAFSPMGLIAGESPGRTFLGYKYEPASIHDVTIMPGRGEATYVWYSDRITARGRPDGSLFAHDRGYRGEINHVGVGPGNRKWRDRYGLPLRELRGDDGEFDGACRVEDFAVSPDGQTLAVADGWVRNYRGRGSKNCYGLRIFRIPQGRGGDCVLLSTFDVRASRVSFSPDGATLAAYAPPLSYGEGSELTIIDME